LRDYWTSEPIIKRITFDRADARPLRILLLATEGPPTQSGIARTVEYLRSGLSARGHTVDIVAHPQVGRFVAGEVRLYNLLRHIPRLLRAAGDYDVIHLHGAAPTFSDAFLLFARTRGARTPLVYTHHCDIGVGPARLAGFYNRVHHWLSGTADQQVFTTYSYADSSGTPDHAAVIPLGIDVNRFVSAQPKDDRFTVLFVGQFRPYKGVPVLLKAAARVHGVRVLFAGRGKQEQACRELAQSLGVDAEFHGSVDDQALRTLYRRAHVVVLPSVSPAEAFGLVLLEGMASECVPVASDLPGVREVLGRIGFTVPPGSVDSLANVLRYLRDNEGLVREIGYRARLRAATFTWERMITDYERLYQALVLARRLERRPSDLDLPHRVTDHVLRSMRAEQADLLLGQSPPELERVGTSRHRVGESREHTRAANVVARYAVQTGERVLLQEGRKPPKLANELPETGLATIAAPITVGSRARGAVVVTRDEPFAERDLDGLTRLTQLIGPTLDVWHETHGRAGDDRPDDFEWVADEEIAWPSRSTHVM
jgi:glycosyltransferase involved in cell wall biosynthesis